MKDFITTVKAMREAQKEYFRTRDRQVLQRSKALEKRAAAEFIRALQKHEQAVTDGKYYQHKDVNV